MNEPIKDDRVTLYEFRIIDAFKSICREHGSASPAEVTIRLHELRQLARYDTAIDIADQMNSLRSRGLL